MGATHADAEREPTQTAVRVPSGAGPAARAAGAPWAVALARAVATGTPLSNRGVARTLRLQRAPAGGGDLQERARQALAADVTDWAGVAEAILTGILDTELPGLRGAVTGVGYDPALTGPVALIDGRLVGGDILVRWVANGFLADVVDQVRTALTPAATVTASTPFREEILKLVAQIDATGVQEKPPVRDEHGKVKPGTGGIGKWVLQDQLDAERKQMGTSFTSCGVFLSNVWNMAKAAAKKQHPGIRIDTRHRAFDLPKSPVPGAWNPASPNMAGGPSPGDAYFLQFTDTREQSHVGIIKAITKVDGDKERWVTADGGQRDQPGGLDRVRERTRTYVRSENLVYGGENADKEARWFHGWTDVDKLVS